MDYLELIHFATVSNYTDANTLLVIGISVLGGAIAVMFRMMFVMARNHSKELLKCQRQCEQEKGQIYEMHKQERKELIEKFDREHRELLENYNSMAGQMTRIIERDTAAKKELVTIVGYMRDDLRR